MTDVPFAAVSGNTGARPLHTLQALLNPRRRGDRMPSSLLWRILSALAPSVG